MPVINYTEAATLDDLRKEFVNDLLERSKAAEAEARDSKSPKDKAQAQKVAKVLEERAEYWRTVHLGHPLRTPPGGKPA